VEVQAQAEEEEELVSGRQWVGGGVGAVLCVCEREVEREEGREEFKLWRGGRLGLPAQQQASKHVQVRLAGGQRL